MVKQQMEVQMLTTMYGEVVKNLELSKTMAAIDEPLIQVIDVPRYPLEKKKTSKSIATIGGFCLMFFLAVMYLLFSRWWAAC
jgi:uncharacterized protein involved in exopolysaccharide biosynthesis